MGTDEPRRVSYRRIALGIFYPQNSYILDTVRKRVIEKRESDEKREERIDFNTTVRAPVKTQNSVKLCWFGYEVLPL